MSEKKNKSWPMSRDQSFIAAAVFLSFFVLWFLWDAVGDKFICWIGGKDNLSGWVQAFGAILSIWATWIISSRSDRSEDRRNRVLGNIAIAMNFGLISSTKNALSAISKHYEFQDDFTREDLSALWNQVHAMHILDSDSLVKISYVKENSAIDLADAICKIQNSITYMKRAKRIYEIIEENRDDDKLDDEITGLNITIKNNLIMVVRLLAVATELYDSALEDISEIMGANYVAP